MIGRRIPRRLLPALLLSTILSAALAQPVSDSHESEDVAAARSLFQRNLDAIRRKDRDAYLACYLHRDNLVRTGPTGIEPGFLSLAAQTGTDWPDFFEGLDLNLVRLRPGLVYGTYRYRVRYGSREETGLSERLFVKTPEGWRIAATSAFPAVSGTPPPPRALVGATLLDGTGAAPVPDSVVVLRGGKIDCAGSRSRCPVPAGIELLDLRGTWLTPGLVDAHVHFSQTGWIDGRPDAFDARDRFPYEQTQARLRANPEVFFRTYLCSGVTTVFDVGGYPWTWGLRERAEADSRAPHVVAAGPLLSTLDFWLNLPAERQFIYLGTEADARDGVRYLAAHRTDAVKVWYLNVPERKPEDLEKVVSAAGEEARRLQLPLIVHATELREAKSALRAGARLLVHSVGDVPVDDEFLRLAREAGAIYCPTLTVVDGYRKFFASEEEGVSPVVDDPDHCVDAETIARVNETARLRGAAPPDPRRAEARRSRFEAFAKVAPANLRRVRDAGIPIAMGTDAGNPLTLHGVSVHAEMEAMQAAGLSAGEVLVASTQGGAQAAGRLKELGTVEAGKAADLLVLSADPTVDIRNLRRIRFVVRGGVVRAREELESAPP